MLSKQKGKYEHCTLYCNCNPDVGDAYFDSFIVCGTLMAKRYDTFCMYHLRDGYERWLLLFCYRGATQHVLETNHSVFGFCLNMFLIGRVRKGPSHRGIVDHSSTKNLLFESSARESLIKRVSDKANGVVIAGLRTLSERPRI